MPRVRFQPLVISKRRWRGPWFPTYGNSDHDRDYDELPYDVEKHDTSDWEDATNASSSANSSRVSSASYDSQETLLERRRKPKKPASAYALRKDCNIYFTAILGTVLIAFVLVLVTLHKRSAAEVRSGLHKPEPKPPPWHEFPKLERYWGGLRTLVKNDDWRPEYPGTEKEVKEEVIEALEEATEDEHEHETALARRGISVDAWARKPHTSPVECFLDEAKRIKVPQLHSYDGVPRGFPASVIGSPDLRNDSTTQCFDRYRRLGPYGFGYSQAQGGIGAGVDESLDDGELWKNQPQIDYKKVEWGQVQNVCIAANQHRFVGVNKDRSAKSAHQLLARSAILIKVSRDHHYSAEELLLFRSLIAEAVLSTGALFAIHLLVHVSDDVPDIWSDAQVYDEVLNEALPQELRGLGTLWSEQQMRLVYGGLAEPSDSIFNAERGSFLPVQHFAHQHAEYESFWIWDMNARYTDNIGRLLTEVSNWARAQPRKELWERSARFYVPTEHGTWHDFSRMVHVLAEHGPADPFRDPGETSASSKTVWGPQPADDSSNSSYLIEAPRSPSEDSYSWGVNEAADFISLSPIFNPSHVSSFPQASDVKGYNTTVALPPRSATTSGIVRLSRRLLLTMHAETAQQKRHMAPELWPASIALHYGYKAVYAPHAMYVDRKWPTDYLSAVLNTGSDGGVVSGRSSVFGEAHRNMFEGLSWGATAGQKSFGRTLWRRWLGYRDEETREGGEEWEEAGEGRLCLPPMLLGCVGNIELVIEGEE